MIATGETTPAAAEVPFFLPLASDPINSGLANHVFTLGEVLLQLPGGAFFSVNPVQIVEKTQTGVGFGQYAVQLTAAQTVTPGIVCVRAVVAGAQPYNGVEEIGTEGGDILAGAAGAIPFFLPNPVDPIFGAPITGHAFSSGEVKLVVPQSNVYVDLAAASITEIGNGYYTAAITALQTALRGKAYIYALIGGSASQRFVGSATILSPAGGGGGLPPVMSNVTPNITFTITPSTPVQFDLTDTGTLGFALPAIIVDPNAAPEIVHDWTDFTPLYKKHSTRVPIANGFRYTILRDGGWPVPPALRLFAVDTTGNVLVV